MRILLDMDEVLSDFAGRALQVHGFTKQEYETQTTGEWDMVKVLGLTLEAFWEPINALEPHFWEHLDILPWAAKLVRLVENTTDDWFIVTAPSQGDRCIEGKRKWIRRVMGERHLGRTVFTAHKHLMANPDTWLIDDRPATAEKFFAAGGNVILFPNRGNANHIHLDRPVKFVFNCLKDRPVRP